MNREDMQKKKGHRTKKLKMIFNNTATFTPTFYTFGFGFGIWD